MGPSILHLSDLHCGWPFVPAVAEALVDLAAELEPAAIAVSGDLVQRGDFPRLFVQAQALLDRLPRPLLVVPGNHDLPLWNPLMRLVRPFARFRRHFGEDLQPVLEVPGAVLAGLCTPRPWILDLGYVSSRQLEHLRRVFARAAPTALRVVVMHHPLVPRPFGWLAQTVHGEARAVAGFHAIEVDLVLNGHQHFPRVVAACEVHPVGPGLVIAQAGTACSSRVRRAAGGGRNSVNLVTARDHELAVTTYEYDPRERRFLARAAALRFPRRARG